MSTLVALIGLVAIVFIAFYLLAPFFFGVFRK